MKNILITGSKGFIGKNLVDELDSKFKIFKFDEEDLQGNWKQKLDQIFKQGLDSVFHIGACSDTLEQRVNYMMLLNYEVTKYITDLCNNHSTKLIYSSSAANYGTNNEYPSNLYGWSKYAGEGYVTSNNGIALRYFNVYGPGEEHKDKMSSVAYQMYIKYSIGESIKLFPKKPLRDFIYVKDVISANIFAMESYDCHRGKWYEVGSGEPRGFEDKMNIMEIPFKYHSEDIIPTGYQFYTCSSKSKWMKGWNPEYSLEKGLSEYSKYLKKKQYETK